MTLISRQRQLYITLWLALFALLIGSYAPLSNTMRIIFLVVIFGVMLINISFKFHQSAVYKKSNHFEHALKKVSIGNDQQPIVMVIGDALPLLFAEKYYFESPEGYFFRIDEIAELSSVIQTVTELNAQWSKRIQLIHLLTPEFHTQEAKIRTDIKSLRWHIDKVRKQLGFMPNLIVTAYFNERYQPHTSDSLESRPWFCEFKLSSRAIEINDYCETGRADAQVITRDHEKYNLAVWLDQAQSLESKMSRYNHAMLAGVAKDFLYQNVLAEYWTDARIAAPIFPLVLSIHFSRLLPSSGNFWAKYIEQLTGLKASTSYESDLQTERTTESQFSVKALSKTFTSHKESIYEEYIYEVKRLPFPDVILGLLPNPKRLKRYESMVYCLTSTGLIFFTCLMTFSYHYNQNLISTIGNHLVNYLKITEADDLNKQNTFLLLKDDLERLEHYYRVGPPSKYQAGLYQGETLYPYLLGIITTAMAEQRVKTEMEQLSTQQLLPEVLLPERLLPSKEVIYLDSFSLFDVGKSKLKPEATTSLIRTLVETEIHKDYVIFIAGHTDNTGNEKQNELLSLRRAEAVRDWMMEASELPINCFAVQGFGASQPIASNTTDSGRQQNRRVEISLVPELAACQP